MSTIDELQEDLRAAARVELDRKNREIAKLLAEKAQLEQQAGLASPDPWRSALRPAGELGDDNWLNSAITPPPTPALLTLPEEQGGGLFVPAGRIGLLVAPGGTGKTTLLVALAVSVALGRKWLKTYEVTPEHVGRVLLILAEEDQSEVKRKLYENVYGLMSPLDAREVAKNIDVLPLAGVPCALLEADPGAPYGAPRSSPFSMWLRELIDQAASEGRPYKLVVADPLSRLSGVADENDNARATRLVQELELLASRGVTVIVAHHTNKGALNAIGGTTQGAARGASALVDGARWVASLEPVRAPDDIEGWGGARSVLRVTKSNYGPPCAPLELFRPIGKPISAASDEDKERWQRLTFKRSSSPSNKLEL